MLIGISKTCHDMRQLRDQIGVHFGMEPVQLTFYLPAPQLNEARETDSLTTGSW